MEYNTIHYTDCLDFLKTVDNNTMDLTITSPPYNLNLRVFKNQYTKMPTDSCMLRTKYKNGYNDSLTMDEYFEWQKTVISELIRVTKKYVFYNIQMVTGNKVALFKLIGHFA
jgi:site-specific DNA-methyltransferase (adenine-specific)/modification methylase